LTIQLQKKIFITQLIFILVLAVPVYLNTYIPFYFVKSNSMYPSIPKGSIIILRNRNYESLEQFKGKVIVFYEPMQKKVLVHRAMNVQEGYLITKGDQNTFIDSFRLHKTNILGEVVLTLPFKNLLKSNEG